MSDDQACLQIIDRSMTLQDEKRSQTFLDIKEMLHSLIDYLSHSVHQEQGGVLSLSPTGQVTPLPLPLEDTQLGINLEKQETIEEVERSSEHGDEIVDELDLGVEMMSPREAHTDLKILNVEEVSSVGEKSLNQVARKLLDEIPTRMISKKTDESFPLQGLWAGNSSINQIKPIAHELGNVPVMINKFGELLNFDLGEELAMPGIDELSCLRILNELSRGNIPLISETYGYTRPPSILQKSIDPREKEIRVVIEPLLEGIQADGMLLFKFLPTEFSYAPLISLEYTKPLVDAFDCVGILMFDPGGAGPFGGGFLCLAEVAQELQLFDHELSGMSKLCSKFCLDPKGEWVMLASILHIWKGRDVMVSTPSCSLLTSWFVWIGICFGAIILDNGGRALAICGDTLNQELDALMKKKLQSVDEELDITNLFGGCLSNVGVKQLTPFAPEHGEIKGCLSRILTWYGSQKLVFDPGGKGVACDDLAMFWVALVDWVCIGYSSTWLSSVLLQAASCKLFDLVAKGTLIFAFYSGGQLLLHVLDGFLVIWENAWCLLIDHLCLL